MADLSNSNSIKSTDGLLLRKSSDESVEWIRKMFF